MTTKESDRNEEGRESPRTRAFLRWAGGKFHLVDTLLRFVPSDVHNCRYYEPFLGAGTLFLALGHRRATLSDLNDHLIDCYRMIRDDPEAVSRELRVHASKDSEAYYYKVRELYNRSSRGQAQAARFIYLNRTGFNGVFRVNQQGEYNVPYGRKKSPRFPSEIDLIGVGRLLQGATLRSGHYESIVDGARKNDFVYLDPPYPPLNGTSFFTHYTSDRFGEKDQVNLSNCARTLDRRGCRVMISNADTREIRRLYSGFEIKSLSVVRFVTSAATKHRVQELIITNYPV